MKIAIQFAETIGIRASQYAAKALKQKYHFKSMDISLLRDRGILIAEITSPDLFDLSGLKSEQEVICIETIS